MGRPFVRRLFEDAMSFEFAQEEKSRKAREKPDVSEQLTEKSLSYKLYHVKFYFFSR
jgi:hypothetical protein